MKKVYLICSVLLILIGINGLASGLTSNSKNSNRHHKTIKLKKSITNVTFGAINYSTYQDYNLTLISGGNSYPLYLPAAGTSSSYNSISVPSGYYEISIVPSTWPSFSNHIGHYEIDDYSVTAPRTQLDNVNLSSGEGLTLQVSAAN